MEGGVAVGKEVLGKLRYRQGFGFCTNEVAEHYGLTSRGDFGSGAPEQCSKPGGHARLQWGPQAKRASKHLLLANTKNFR